MLEIKGRVNCKQCSKEFKPYRSTIDFVKIDGLCSPCRTSKKTSGDCECGRTFHIADGKTMCSFCMRKSNSPKLLKAPKPTNPPKIIEVSCSSCSTPFHTFRVRPLEKCVPCRGYWYVGNKIVEEDRCSECNILYTKNARNSSTKCTSCRQNYSAICTVCESLFKKKLSSKECICTSCKERERICLRCELPYYISGRTTRLDHCFDCSKAISYHDLYIKNKEHRREVNREWKRTSASAKTSREKYQLNNRFRLAVAAAENRKLNWKLTEEQYLSLVEEPCHYCGEDVGTGVGLDRIMSKVGYILDNVLPCCGTCNIIKGDRLTAEEMKVAMEAVIKLRTSKTS